jgi:F0F1-type ATP synthase membrane subunit b/b'
MLAFLSNLILLFAESGQAVEQSGSAWGKFVEFWDHYLNYPGFEAWRFLNLLIFIAIMVYLIRKPLSDAFKTKRESIRADLIKAEEERQAAITELTDAEARLARLDSEKAEVLKDSKSEASAEIKRIADEAESDITRMQGQAESEIARKTLQARLKLRRFSADESIRLAEEKIKSAMNVSKDAELVKVNIQSIGGMK